MENTDLSSLVRLYIIYPLILLKTDKIRIMKQFTLLLLLSLSAFTGNTQCPSTLTINVQTVTDCTCPDNGTVVLGGNGTGNPEVTFKIISGPSHVGMEQSSHIFHSLSAGTYQFAAICNTQTVYVNATINNLFSPLSNSFTVTTSGICANYSAGGTITVSGVTGGTLPYSYSFISNSSANYDDALSVYQPAAAYSTIAWGTYQVRVKDACGTFITKTVNLQPDNLPVAFSGANVAFDDIACDSAGLYFWMMDDAGTGVVISDYTKLRFNVYEKSSSSCAPGALIKTFELNTADEQYMVIPRRDVYIEVINSCGVSRSNCYDYPDNDSLVTRWIPLIKGCGSGPDPYSLTIKHQYNEYAKPPITVDLYNNATNTLLQSFVTTSNWECGSFTGLPVAGTYKIIVTDACAKKDTVILAAPTGGIGIAPVGSGSVVDKECSYKNGTTTAKLKLTGYLANMDITTVTITSGPDNIGQTSTLNPYDGLFYFHNLTPNAVYGFTIANGCGSTVINFTVTTPVWDIITFTMQPVVSQQCGSSGNIDADITYFGWGNYRSELWNGSTLVDANNSGQYANIPAGNYTLLAIAEQDWCDGRTSDTLQTTVTVLPSGTLPTVSRKVSFVCESGGIPTTKGYAYIETSGFGPFRYDLKRISPSPEAVYTNLAANAPASYTISNLDAYAIYSLMVTDNCGNSTLSEISVGTMGSLALENAYQPCRNSAFLLQAPSLAGATYSWANSSSPSVVLSSTRALFFANYVEANDGEYICTITLGGGCLQRTLTADLASFYCGAVLPVTFTEVTARQQDCKSVISFTVTGELAEQYEIESSYDNRVFQKIATLYAKDASTDSLTRFRFTDNTPARGYVYYRIKAIFKGTHSYSRVVKTINTCQTGARFSATVYPNPVTNSNAEIDLYCEKAGKTGWVMTNGSGLHLGAGNLAAVKGNNHFNIDLTRQPAGIYFVTITSEGQSVTLKVYKQK